MEKKTYLLFLLGYLLGIDSQRVSAAKTRENFLQKDSDVQPTADSTDEKGSAQQPFKVGQRIALPVEGAVYIVERKLGTPDVLTISMQLDNGNEQVLGLVPMAEVQLMLEDAKLMGSGLPRALLGSSFISYAFGNEPALPKDISAQDLARTAKLAQQFIEAEAQAQEQHDRMSGKKQGDEEGEAADEDDEEGHDGVDEGEEDEKVARDTRQATEKEASAEQEDAVLQNQGAQNGVLDKGKSLRGLVD